MSRKMRWECDRCGADLDKKAPTHTIEVHLDQETALDLCDGCARQLERLMDGEAIEEPP